MQDHKVIFVKKVREVITQLANVADTSKAMHKIYFDRGYNTGGTEITDEDILSNTGLTADQLSDAVTLLNQFLNFCDNQAVIQSDYRSTMNIIRTDM